MFVHSPLARSCFLETECGLHSHMDETWARAPLVLARLPAIREIKLKKNHDRNPDIGLRISVSMQYEDGSDGAPRQCKD